MDTSLRSVRYTRLETEESEGEEDESPPKQVVQTHSIKGKAYLTSSWILMEGFQNKLTIFDL